MLKFAYSEQGDRKKPVLVGLAAPQVLISKRIILVDVMADGHGKVGDLRVYINPEITWKSKDEAEWYEGCFSTDRVCGIVTRPSKVKIKAYTPEGKLVEESHKGYIARIFQHEIDHLNGKEFTTHITDDEKLHWVEDGQFPQYRDKEAWRTWSVKCPRERWEKIKGIRKTVLVTGGSSGIGKAIVMAFANEGFNVIFTYNSKKKESESIVKELEKLGAKAMAIKVDMHSERDMANLFKIVKEKFKNLDILVNNAGVNRPRDLFDTKVWKEVFQVNLFSVVYCTGKAVELMKNGGKIINISSIYGDGKACWKGLPAYGASKAAISHFTQTLAKNLAPKILVNAIAPGYVKTPLWKDTSEEEFERSGKEQLIERMIRPEEIAQMAVAIAKNNAMTGEIVVVDGGISLKTV